MDPLKFDSIDCKLDTASPPFDLPCGWHLRVYLHHARGLLWDKACSMKAVQAWVLPEVHKRHQHHFGTQKHVG